MKKLRAALRLLFSLNQVRWRSRDTSSWSDLIDVTFTFAEGFFRPKQIRPELELFLARVERERPRVVVEIGSARGGTFFLLSRAAADNAILISIDLPGGKWGGGYGNWRTLVFRRLLLPGQSSYFIREDSHHSRSFREVKRILKGSGIDLLFIDGDHSYEGVKADYQMYSTLVRPGGLIAFHDIVHHPPSLGCHVDRFWQELRAVHCSHEIVDDPTQGWGGIGFVEQSRCGGPVGL